MKFFLNQIFHTRQTTLISESPTTDFKCQITAHKVVLHLKLAGSAYKNVGPVQSPSSKSLHLSISSPVLP